MQCQGGRLNLLITPRPRCVVPPPPRCVVPGCPATDWLRLWPADAWPRGRPEITQNAGLASMLDVPGRCCPCIFAGGRCHGRCGACCCSRQGSRRRHGGQQVRAHSFRPSTDAAPFQRQLSRPRVHPRTPTLARPVVTLSTPKLLMKQRHLRLISTSLIWKSLLTMGRQTFDAGALPPEEETAESRCR